MGSIIMVVPEQRLVVDDDVEPERYDELLDEDYLEEFYDGYISDLISEVDIYFQFEED